MKYLVIIFHLLIFCACSGQKAGTGDESRSNEEVLDQVTVLPVVETYYLEHKQDSVIGNSTGSVSNGSLKNGTLLPFEGANFQYFDTTSYLEGRAFTHQLVAQTLLDTYKILAESLERKWFLMELSNEHGGKIFPHRTHQNGISVDFMSPLKKDGEDYFELDYTGAQHYMLEFDNDGKLEDDSSVSLDFNQIAYHLIVLDEQARKHGLKIEKVIFKMELRDELFATPNGKKLLEKNIYVTRNLTPLINSLHDDHYHVDFKKL